MELLAQAQAVYAARGTKEYPAMLALLPEGYRDNYHQIIQKGAQYVVTLFLAQRAVESIKVMDVTDLVLEFSYWREVSIWPQMMMLTFEVDLITNSAIISGGTAGANLMSVLDPLPPRPRGAAARTTTPTWSLRRAAASSRTCCSPTAPTSSTRVPSWRPTSG